MDESINMVKIHKLIIETQRGTGKKFRVHACGTGCKVSELTSTSDNKKVTCKKCLARLRK